MTERIAVSLNEKKDLPALIQAGADIVVAAVKGYSSTALQQIAAEEIPGLKESAEASGASFHLLVNKLFHETETEDLKQFLIQINAMGIQAVWFADPAVLAIKEEEHLSFACIYMPDTLLTSTQDLAVWRDMGAARGVISPLLNLEEVRVMAACSASIVPVHGHYLMSRSYRRLLTAWKEAYGIEKDLSRDRTLALREKKRQERMPVYEDETGTLIYTDYVLSSFRVFDALRREDGIYLINSVYSDSESIREAVGCYAGILQGKKAEDMEQAYRNTCGNEKLSEGYYGENVQ